MMKLEATGGTYPLFTRLKLLIGSYIASSGVSSLKKIQGLLE
jgi:hypothetical protein